MDKGVLLVTGVSGYLGARVARRARRSGWRVVGARLTGPPTAECHPLDLRDRGAVDRFFDQVRPDCVIHTAAGRDPDDWHSTADGTAHVAHAAARTGARLVHVSTDSVFSGRQVYYDEAATPDPVYPYGVAKAAAETAVRAAAPDAAIVRTSLVLGDGHGRHETLTHDLASGRVQGALFADEIRAPVHVDDLVAALLELAVVAHRGVLNVAGADALSRYELGLLVARRDGLDPASLPAARSADLGLRRPTDVRLVCALAARVLTTRLRGASDFLRAS